MEITPDLVRELLHYDPDTGVLTWRFRPAKYFSAKRHAAAWNARYANRTAGAILRSDKHAYERISVHVSINGVSKSFCAHRLAWMHFYKTDAPKMIDHINRNALDNRISNLRPASYQVNTNNKTKPTNNTSGVVGVHLDRGRWVASCCVGGGKRQFVGSFTTKMEAACAIAQFRQERGLPMHNHAQYLRR